METRNSSKVEFMMIDGPEHLHGSPISFEMLGENMEIDEPEHNHSSHSDISMTSIKPDSRRMDEDTVQGDKSDDSMYDVFEDDAAGNDDADEEDYTATDMSDEEIDDEYDDDEPPPKKVKKDALNKEASLPTILIGSQGTSTTISPNLSEAERRKMMKNIRHGLVVYSQLDIESIQIKFRK